MSVRGFGYSELDWVATPVYLHPSGWVHMVKMRVVMGILRAEVMMVSVRKLSIGYFELNWVATPVYHHPLVLVHLVGMLYYCT